MKKIFLIALCLPTMVFAQEADKLLRNSDRARGGLEQGVSWNVTLQSWEDGNESKREFAVKAKADDALAESTAPARNKGEVFLFNDKMMWFFKPSIKKPVSISARQKLSGQAANGDIASTHYARDYTATLEKEDTINGEKTKVLLLKAKNNKVTYDQIRYWVSEGKQLAVKAEFLTMQGKVFKSATFEYKNTLTEKGKTYPFISQMTIIDAKNPKNKSIMSYTNPSAQAHAGSLFNVNNLSR